MLLDGDKLLEKIKETLDRENNTIRHINSLKAEDIYMDEVIKKEKAYSKSSLLEDIMRSIQNDEFKP